MSPEELTRHLNARELRIPLADVIEPVRELVVTRWQHRERGIVMRLTVVPRVGAPVLPVGADPYAEDAPEYEPEAEIDLPADHPGVEVLGMLLCLCHRRATEA